METNNKVSLQFQFFTLAATASIIIFLFFSEANKICILDEGPQIFKLTPKEGVSVTPTKVKVGMTVKGFPEFDVEHNKFVLLGVVWFVFDPTFVSLDTIGKFSFLRGKIEQKSAPATSLRGENIVAQYDIRVSFKTGLYYGFFPLDDHAIFLSLVNTAVNQEEIMFESSQTDFVISDNVSASGWTLDEHAVEDGYGVIPLGAGLESESVAYPQVQFEMRFLHQSMRYIISLLLPLLIIFFIDLFSFCLDQRKDYSDLLAISIGNVVALVAYSYVIESISPQVGYLLLSDYAFFLFLSITGTVFLINTVGPYLTIVQKKIISILLQMIVLAVFAFLFFVWIPC